MHSKRMPEVNAMVLQLRDFWLHRIRCLKLTVPINCLLMLLPLHLYHSLLH